MTPLAEILRDEIRRSGPLRFSRFMGAALYHPEHGYYRRDRFGRAGDFYTAEQVQPAFGLLVARFLENLLRSLQSRFIHESVSMVVELGAGRGEMRPALSRFDYLPIEIDSGALPSSIRGVVFSNEFFDALSVDRVVIRHGLPFEVMVGWDGDRFVWTEGGRVEGETAEYLRRYFPDWTEGRLLEVNREALRWIRQVADSLVDGFHVAIDYGYTTRESARFPAGSLMSYRRHQAIEDVLADPGEQDITAHVAFDPIIDHGALHGLQYVSLQTLGQVILETGASDNFVSVLGDPPPLEFRLQLKTLLFGMGDTFRVLVQRKVPVAAGGGSKTVVTPP